MLTGKIKNVLVLILLIVAVTAVQGQQSNLTEEDLIANAQKFFEQEKWQDALPLYAQLVSVHPEKPEYNYKFGVCTLMGNRSDKRRPVRYLNNAYRSMSDNAELMYYLGLAYYQNGEFANAMKFLNLYLAKLDADSPKRPLILEQINACLNGMNLEHKNLVEEVLSSTEFQTDNFHRAYRADELDGSLILKPENFVSTKEKNSGKNSFVYVSEPRGILYYSGYVDNNATHRDIFKVALKENGKWGNPEKISDKINTNFDEDYPIVSDNGSTLYFSSKGHNSIGGYDIYKSSIDPATNEFGAPENMGMGINSPFDDILFIPDNSGKGAFYASNRENLGNGINVYRIRMNTEGFADQQMLAQQSIQTKIENVVDTEVKTAVATTQDEEENKHQFASKPIVEDPKKKAADLVKQRNYVNQLADSAYYMVTNMKALIRDLTNKRDRANMISSNKKDKAKSMEAEYEQIVAELPVAASSEDFEKGLERAIRQKEEIYQYRQRADQANLIAWKLGKQIKIKNNELNQLKIDAGKVQSLSVSGDYEQTQLVYTQVRESFRTADTLADFAQNINWINNDQVAFDIPDTEIAFAEKLREGYENQTLLAMTQAQQGAVATFDESVPINIVDQRTDEPAPVLVVALQVEQVQFVPTAGIDPLASLEEDLELDFNIDAIEPYQLINPVEVPVLAFSDSNVDESLELSFAADIIEAMKLVVPVTYTETELALIDETGLELDFNIDAIEPYQLINPVEVPELAFSDSNVDESLELSFDADIIEAMKLVVPVIYMETELAFIEETGLELDFDIDATEPYRLISPVESPTLAFNDPVLNESLELNFNADIIEATKVIEQVLYTDYELVSVDDDLLELNFNVDRVDAEPVILQLSMEETDYVISIGDEELEIDHRIDLINPDAVVQPIVYEESSIAFQVDETELDINNTIDRVEAEKVIQLISFDETAFAMNPAEEELEINQLIDQVDPEPLVSQVAYTGSAIVAHTQDESLEINMEADPIETTPQVEPVAFMAAAFEEADEDLEVTNTADAITPFDQVETVNYTALAMAEIEESDLEISVSFENDVYDLVDPVAFDAMSYFNTLPEEESIEIASYHDLVKIFKGIKVVNPEFAALEMPEEELEINLEDEVNAIALVAPVYINEAGESLSLIDEDLEIRLEQNAYEAEQLVNAVEFTGYEIALNPEDENLEIHLEPDVITPASLVAPVENASIASAQLEFLEEELDVSFEVDAVEAYANVQQVEMYEVTDPSSQIHDELEIRIEQEQRPVIEVAALVLPVSYQSSTQNVVVNDEKLELNFTIDGPRAVEPFKLVQPVNYDAYTFVMPDADETLEVLFSVDTMMNERLMADNAGISSRDVAGVPGIPEAGTELFYLRESVSIAADIETSNTDVEMLRIAIENPELLSYEELLFAASLAPIPEDKLKIYNYAFIHIDRDWRAFNNAAVTAMNMKDLDQAEVYLYQASLISSENGKVQNNMGILACYKQDFTTAENHFLAANQLGVNSEYNLKLIKQLRSSSRQK